MVPMVIAVLVWSYVKLQFKAQMRERASLECSKIGIQDAIANSVIIRVLQGMWSKMLEC